MQATATEIRPCCLDPFNKFAANEVRRCLKEGLSGIGELAFYESGIDETALDKLAPLFEICLENDFPALIHTNEPVGHTYPGKTPNTMSQVYTLVKRFPENKIVLAHWGGGIFLYNILKKEVKQSLKNVYFDTAASPFLYDSEIYRLAIKLAGQEKMATSHMIIMTSGLIMPGLVIPNLNSGGNRRRR